MDRDEILKTAKDLLKSLKEDPKAQAQFEELNKAGIGARPAAAKMPAAPAAKPPVAPKMPGMKPGMSKDDKPHPTGSPEDKAHDVVEDKESVKEAMAGVHGGSKERSEMLSHLRTLDDPSKLRSPHNRVDKQQSSMMDKGQLNPNQEAQGGQIKAGGSIKKEEMCKDSGGKSKHDRCVEHVKESSPEVKNPHAVCVAEGVRPAKWKKSEAVEKMLKEEFKPRFQKCGYVYKKEGKK